MTEQNEPDQRPRILLVNGVPMATSWAIAEHFEKEHRNVLRAIEDTISKHAHRPEFIKNNFIRTTHVNARGKSLPIFRLTEFAFMTVVMGFTGQRAADWQWIYGQTFIKMRDALQRGLTKSISDALTECNNLIRDQALTIKDQAIRLRNAAAEAKISESHRVDAHANLLQNRALTDRLIAENVKYQVEKHFADQILTNGYSADISMNEVLALKETLGELVRDFALKDSQHKQAFETFQYSQKTVDPRRAECFEMHFLIQAAFGGHMVEASLIWAFICLRATEENLSVPLHGTEPVDRSFADPKPWIGRPATLTQVMALTGDLHSRKSLWAAADRLAAQGIVVIEDRSVHAGRSNFYRLRLVSTLQKVQASRSNGEWVSAHGSVSAAWNGMTVTLPNPGEFIPPKLLINAENPQARHYVVPRQDYRIVFDAPKAVSMALAAPDQLLPPSLH